MRILPLALVAVLGGCATAYQSSSLTGGYGTRPVFYGRLQEVWFSGNGFTDADTVQRYALYRCAEMAKEQKKPYFVMYDSLMAASLGKTADIPAVGSVGGKPTAFVFVQWLDAPRSGAKEAEKTMQELEPQMRKAGHMDNGV